MKIIVKVDVVQSDIPVRGNVMCTEDKESDRKAEDWVLEHLRNGNIYAWCDCMVTVTCGPFTSVDSLGGISYATRDEFEKDILVEMKANAIADLKRCMQQAPAEVERAKRQAKLAKDLLVRFDKLEVVEE